MIIILSPRTELDGYVSYTRPMTCSQCGESADELSCEDCESCDECGCVCDEENDDEDKGKKSNEEEDYSERGYE